MLDERRAEKAKKELERSTESLMSSLDAIDVGIPNFLGLEKHDVSAQRDMKLQAIWLKYGKAICENELVHQLAEDTVTSRRITLVCAIADIFGFHGSLSVAALIVKEGLNTWCESHWKKA